MQTFKIFVVGIASAGKTAFIKSVSEIGVVAIHDSDLPALDFGRLTTGEESVLYLFGHPASFRIEGTFETLRKKGLLFPKRGFIVIMDSVPRDREDKNVMAPRRWGDVITPDLDRENAHFLRYIQEQNQSSPLVVALSKQDLPNARTPQKMRDILAIPDDIKVLGYNLKDPSSTKKVVLALVELFPRDELAQRVIEGLKAKIE